MGSDVADVAVLIAALQTPRPTVREATVWRIVELMSAAPVAPRASRAAAPDPASPSVTWSALGAS